MTSLVESTKKNSLSSSLSRLMPESMSNAPSQALDTTINSDTGSSVTNFFSNITWQTWLIVVLILALLGINLFSYLAKATTDVSGFINKYFGPILALFGIGALETTKQTINTSATGTKAGVDFVADTTTGAIDTVEDVATTTTTKTTTATTAPSTSATARPSAQKASSSQKGSMPVQQQIQEAGSVYEWNQGSLDSALNDAAKQPEPMPNETANYTTGKAGWCFIGDDRSTRACAQVGVNDMCMSGDIFPTQEVCMNPNLRV
jgi:hypothetical protein